MYKDVIDVEPLDGLRLLLSFEGGERRRVDIGELVSFSGVFEPLRDESYFRRVAVNAEIGTICWPNGADLCPDVLYEASVPADPAQAAAAK